MGPDRRFVGDDHRGGTVVNPRCVSGGDGAFCAEQRLELLQCIDGRAGTRMLIDRDLEQRVLPVAAHRYRNDLLGMESTLLRRDRALLAAQCEGILVSTGNLVIPRDILAGARHRLGTVKRIEGRVDEAPAHRRVLKLLAATKGAVSLANHERCTCHALNPARDGKRHLVRTDRARCFAHRLKARGTQAVESHPRHRVRQAGQQQTHPRNVAIILARLVGAAIEHFLDCCRIETLIAGEQCPHRHRTEVVGAHIGKAAAIATDWRADGITDEGFSHGRSFHAASDTPVSLRRSSMETPSTVSTTKAPCGPTSNTPRSV